MRNHPGVRLAALIAMVMAALTLGITPAAHADGDPDNDIVRDLSITYELDETGDLHVTETYQWDFRDRNGLGFYRTLVRQMGYEPDDSKLRVYEYGNYQAHSTSGAPAIVWVDSKTDAEVKLAVGAPDGSDDTRTGVQTYVLSYDVEGAINPVRGRAGAPDQDELYYNVFTDIPNQVDKVTVTVTGPADVTDLACYQGPEGSRNVCDQFNATAATATFTGVDLERGDGFTIMAAFPPETFSEPGPILIDRPLGSGIEAAAQGAWPFLVGGWVALLGAIALVRKRIGRDWHYPELEVGALPVAGQQYAQQRMKVAPQIVQRTTPPDWLRPAEAIVIADETTSTKAFMATMIDLAVRGHLTIEPQHDDGQAVVDDWRLTVNPQPPAGDQLYGYEHTLMSALFAGRRSVLISDLRGKFADELKHFNKALTAHSDERGWFTRRGLVGGGTVADYVVIAIVALGILGGLVSFIFLSGINTLAVMAMVGSLALLLVWFLTSEAAHARSALGRAHYEQIRGFREHLGSVEGHQLRWQTGDDIFSDYLPWAVGFELTERWVGLFKELADEGRYNMTSAWYVGSTYNNDFDSIGDSVQGLESSGVEALDYTPGSSGDSGSFSSGGFSGGGGGGGSFGGR